MDGCVRLRFTARGLEEVTRWVMGYGANVKVLSPSELVERVATNLREAAERYEA